MEKLMKNVHWVLILIFPALTILFGGCGEDSISSNSEDTTTKEDASSLDSLDDLRLKKQGLTYTFQLVDHEEDIEIVINFDFEGTEAEYSLLKKNLSLLKVRKMEDRFIYDQPNNPASRKPLLVSKKDQKITKEEEQGSSTQEEGFEDLEPVKEREVYHFTGHAKWGKGDLETVALQKMWNKDPRTALSGDKNGHGAPGKEICAWGNLSQDAFEKDQEINREEIKQVTGYPPNIGVYDHIMVDYYNWRMENVPKYKIYFDEIAPTCEEQKNRISSGQ